MIIISLFIYVLIMKYDMLSIKPALPSLITLFFAYIGFSITTPVLIDLSLKATNHYFWLTIMMSSYPIGAILGANLIGIMSDYLGRKKTLLVSLLLSAICYALAGVAIYHQSMIWLACIRLLQGSIEGSMVIAQRTIADTIPQKKHSRFFSYLYSFPATAFIIGPNILAYNIMSQNQSDFSYATLFWLQSIIMLGCAWLVQATFADYHQEKSSHNWKEDIKAFIQSIQTNRRLRYVYVTNFFIFIVSTGFLRYYPIYIADHFQANIIVNSITISWVAMGSLITYLCINPLLFKQFKPKQIIVISGSALSLSMLITSPPYLASRYYCSSI